MRVQARAGRPETDGRNADFTIKAGVRTEVLAAELRLHPAELNYERRQVLDVRVVGGRLQHTPGVHNEHFTPLEACLHRGDNVFRAVFRHMPYVELQHTFGWHAIIRVATVNRRGRDRRDPCAGLPSWQTFSQSIPLARLTIASSVGSPARKNSPL